MQQVGARGKELLSLTHVFGNVQRQVLQLVTGATMLLVSELVVQVRRAGVPPICGSDLPQVRVADVQQAKQPVDDDVMHLAVKVLVPLVVGAAEHQAGTLAVQVAALQVGRRGRLQVGLQVGRLDVPQLHVL